MGTKRKKLVELNIEHKREVLDFIDKGVSQRALSEKFGVSKSTIGNINKNREVLMKTWDDNWKNDRKRKLRKTENESVNILVLEFFQECRTLNIPVSGPMLQAKAREIAQRLHIEAFQASNGWLESFRLRNNIKFRSVYGEAEAVDLSEGKGWKLELVKVLRGYPPENRFNADETELFYRQLPVKSLVHEAESYVGVELAKERLSVLFCCSATGEKLKPLVIGSVAQPRVDLPVTWCCNKRAWMTAAIFGEWLSSVNQEMERENRKILLLVDNAACHYGTQKMSHVVVKFIPPNSEVQPLNQGIIRAVKAQYWKLMLQCRVMSAETCKTTPGFSKLVTVLDAVRWIDSAWRDTSSGTIVKYFRHAGFYQALGSEEDLRARPRNIKNELVRVDEPAGVDEEAPSDAATEEVLATLTETASSQATQHEHGDDGAYSVGGESGEPPSTYKDALRHVEHLMKYASALHPSLMGSLLNIYKSIEVQWVSAEMNAGQATIGDYFGRPDHDK